MFKFIPYNKSDQDLPEKCYIIASNGMFIKKKNEVFASIVKIEQVRSLLPLNEMASYQLPQLGRKFLMKTWKFFREIYLKHKSEAVMFIYYNRISCEYEAYVPEQEVTSGNTKNIDLGQIVPQLDNCILVGTIHSHASMTAFHSSIDDADEKFFDGLHITFGNLNYDKLFDLSVSIVINGKRFNIDTLNHLEGVIKNNSPKPEELPEIESEDSVKIVSEIKKNDDSEKAVEPEKVENGVEKKVEVESVNAKVEIEKVDDNIEKTSQKSIFNKLFEKISQTTKSVFGHTTPRTKNRSKDNFNPEFDNTFDNQGIVHIKKAENVPENPVNNSEKMVENSTELPITYYNPSPSKNRYYSRFADWKSKKDLFLFDQSVEDILDENDIIEVNNWVEKVSGRFGFMSKKKSSNQVVKEEIIKNKTKEDEDKKEN